MDLIDVKKLKKYGSVKLGKIKFNSTTKKIFVDMKAGKTSSDLLNTGFYFVVSDGTAKSFVASVNHVGHQKKPRGFKEVLTRLNNPRTEQNSEFSNVILMSVEKSKSVIRSTNFSLVYMTYQQVNEMLGYDEYNSKNNGLELISKLREKFLIPSREFC